MPTDELLSPPADSPTPAAPSPDAQPVATGAVAPPAALAERIERASAIAVEQHLGETPTKRGHGQRGPDRKPRKRKSGLPLADLVDQSGPASVVEGPPAPLAPVVFQPPPFDEETARTLVDIGVGLLNDAAAAIVRSVALKETGDARLADEAAKEVRMSDKIETAVKTGAIQCAKKYAVRLDYAPEMMLFGGLIIWGGQVSLSVKALKGAGLEIRAAAAAAKKAA